MGYNIARKKYGHHFLGNTIFIISLLATGLFPFQLHAQSNSTVRVQVTSKVNGAPLNGSNVKLLSYDEQKLKHSGVTDANGFIEFSGIKTAKYYLVISFVGYETYKETVQLEKNENSVKQVALKIKMAQLGNLVVESNREVATGQTGVRKISRADISHIPTPAAGGDLAAYLRTVPGVISTGDRGGELYIRGGIPSQNKVLVDNLPIVKPFHISSLYSAFPQQTIQNVDLYTGGFDAKYSGATSAIIDVKLRPGNFKEFNASASSSPYLASLQLEGPITAGRTSYMIMGRKSLIKNSSSALYKDKKDINFSDFTGRFSYHGDDVTCNATGIYTYDRGKINPARNISLTWQNIVVGANCLDFAESLNHPIEFTAGYSYFQNGEGSKTTTERNSSREHFFFKFSQDVKLWGLPIDYGLKFHVRTFGAKLAERFTQFESYHQNQGSVNIYASTVWSPGNQIQINPSIGTLATLAHAPVFEPRLRVAYHPAGRNDIELSIAGGKYYQAQAAISDVRDAGSIFKFWKIIGQKDKLPSAVHGLVGYKERFGNYFTINVDGYVKNYDDIPVPKWTPVAKLNTVTTLANGRAYGADLQIKYENNPLFFSLGYGYSKVKYEAASDNLGAWIQETLFSYHPSFDQRHKINAVASYTTHTITTNVSWAFGSGQPYTKVFGFDLAPDFLKPFNYLVPTNPLLDDPGTARTLYSRPFGQRLPVYHRLDLSIEHTFTVSNKFSLNTKAGAINLYNRKNIFYFDSNTIHRVNQTQVLPYISVEAQFQ